MSVEGLWTIKLSETEEFYDSIQVGEQYERGGNFVLINKKLYGAGISFYFTGNYETSGATISLKLKAERYNDIASGIFGAEDTAIFILKGTIENDVMKLHGYLENDKNKMLFIEAFKQTSL